MYNPWCGYIVNMIVSAQVLIVLPVKCKNLCRFSLFESIVILT